MWAKIEGGIFDNPKIERAGLYARVLYLASVTHCAKTLSDGFVPDDMIARLAFKVDVPPEQIAPAITRLTSLKLWHRDDPEGGYRVHDYLKYNPTRADYEEFVATRQENGKKGGRPPKKPAPRLGENHSANHGGLHGANHDANHRAKHRETTAQTYAKPPREAVSVFRDPYSVSVPEAVPDPTDGGSSTSFASRRDASQLGVAPAVEGGKPSLVAKPARDARWHRLSDALAEGCGVNPQTQSEQAYHAKRVDELAMLSPPPTPELVLTVCERYRAEWPDATCSQGAIVKHYSRFAAPAGGKGRRGSEEDRGAAARDEAMRLLRGGKGRGGAIDAHYTTGRITDD